MDGRREWGRHRSESAAEGGSDAGDVEVKCRRTVLWTRSGWRRLEERLDDRIPGGHPIVVLTYDYWKTRFSGDPSIVGKTLLIDNRSMTVVGFRNPVSTASNSATLPNSLSPS